MREPVATTCERCGTTFGCRAATGSCWCGEVAVPAAAREKLAAAYDRCVCPACLAELSTTPIATVDRDRRTSREDA